jgi:mersacidin/lichenicidin family type 2 lantibiotic
MNATLNSQDPKAVEQKRPAQPAAAKELSEQELRDIAGGVLVNTPPTSTNMGRNGCDSMPQK